MDRLAELLRQGADKLVNFPTEAQRFITNPQAFTQLLTGKNPLPKETGFVAGATGLPPKNPVQGGVLNPASAPYQEGYEQGEPVGIASMALPAYAMALRAGAPKAAQMAENYMANQGFMPTVIPSNPIKALPDDYNKLSTMATEAYDALRKNPSQETADYYKMIMKARDDAPVNNPKNVQSIAPQTTLEDYKGQHQAPTATSGKPLFDLTDIYPEDFYSAKGVQYYGVGSPRDAVVISQLQYLRNKPNQSVWMYRAVPKDAPSTINKGDWVTIDRQYAKEHGESALNNEYKIVKRKVYARDLFTNGDSPFEMGYDPQPKISRKEILEQQINKIE
jgi:hypothetical protein